jgi:hypothetical protein
MMTSTLMNSTKNSSTLPESMQRMITPQYEQIVNEIEHIYHHPDTGISFIILFRFMFEILFFSGLITIAQWLGLSIMAPNKKISILLIGNHSAGKLILCLMRDRRSNYCFFEIKRQIISCQLVY